jgi:hypothetical protein
MRHKTALLLVACVLLALTACGEDSKRYLEFCAPATDKKTGKDATSTPPSASTAAEAVEIVRRDAAVRELTDGREFTSPRQIPWSAGDSVGGKGWVVAMRFAEPFSVDSDGWPFIISPGAGRDDTDSTPRLLCTSRAKGQNLITLGATVNMDTRQVEELGSLFAIKPNAPLIAYEDIGPLPEEYQTVPGY